MRQHTGSEWYGRPAVSVVDGVVVCVYKHGSHHAVNDGELHIKFSDDYGATWSDEDKTLLGASVTGFPMNPPDLHADEDAGEPWIMIAPNGDLLLHMWKADFNVVGHQHGTWQSRSTDGGETWATATQVLPTGLATPDEMFATDDHFVYNGVLYVGGRHYSTDWQEIKCLIIKSADSGATWEFLSFIGDYDPLLSEIGMEYVGNNRIVAIIRGDTMSFKSISDDLGATWSEPIPAGIQSAGRSRILTKTHLQGGANWWNDSTLIMIGFVPNRRTSVWVSLDAGDTWTGPFFVDTQTEDCGYGDIFYNPNTGKYVMLNYFGTLDAADVKQYNLTITGT